MTLPDVCPRDGASRCKRTDCHLYVVDWRSGDEQCIIGYRSTHKTMSRSTPVVDVYAERTRLKRETKSEQVTIEEPRTQQPETDTGPHDGHCISEFYEEIVASDKDTTVIESKVAPQAGQPVRKKGKPIDDVMDLDLPADYEEEFWKK